jgi:hypothetical protein
MIFKLDGAAASRGWGEKMENRKAAWKSKISAFAKSLQLALP